MYKTFNMSLKAVLFDMDGVIVDTEPLHRKAYFKTFDELEIAVSKIYTLLLQVPPPKGFVKH